MTFTKASIIPCQIMISVLNVKRLTFCKIVYNAIQKRNIKTTFISQLQILLKLIRGNDLKHLPEPHRPIRQRCRNAYSSQDH